MSLEELSGGSSAASAQSESDFARRIRAGLSKEGQKKLPSQYFYDDIGSALFEVITLLPEYGLTRADTRLIRRHATEIVHHLHSPLAVAELGSGTGTKTRSILEAVAQREAVVYFPIEISPAALAKCSQELGHLGSVIPVGRSYLDGLRDVAAKRKPGQSLLILFLGSTIGNFERPAAVEFLGKVREALMPGDALLLGTDLEKEIPRMLLAYDDPTGVTAAFNLNLLARINRDLNANFVLRNFVHEVRYNQRERRIEMHLRSTVSQRVLVRDADLTLEIRKDETIWTEACHKFRIEDIREMARHSGFCCASQWTDREWEFTESLLIAD